MFRKKFSVTRAITDVFTIAVFFAALLSTAAAFCDDRLHKAAYDGDVELVKTILKGPVDPDERDSFGGTALHAAMFQKNAEIVVLLIDHGFDVNAIGPANGYSPLHDAVWANNLEAVKILLKRGARTDIAAKDGLTPFEKAKNEGTTEIVEYMKSQGHPGK